MDDHELVKYELVKYPVPRTHAVLHSVMSNIIKSPLACVQVARVWLGVAAGSMLQSSVLLTIMSRWDWVDKAREVVKAIKAGQAPLAGGH